MLTNPYSTTLLVHTSYSLQSANNMAGGRSLHFRKPSNPSKPFLPSRTLTYRQKRALQTYGPPILGIIALVWLFLHFIPRSSAVVVRQPPSGTPPVVIVTTLDPQLPDRFKEAIRDNRRQYAAHHGYATFFPSTADYDLGGYPESWSTVPALRHAMTLHPHTEWMWYLDSTALIANSTRDLHIQVLSPHVLESLMIRNASIIPPDSTVKTDPNLKVEQVGLIISQDAEGLGTGSMLIRTGDWAQYFLDMWFEPLYRTYNFKRLEIDALQHILQWHMPVLAHVALIPQRVLNSYEKEAKQESRNEDGKK